MGLALGWLPYGLLRFVRNPVVAISLTLLTPYLAYLAAEALHLSGVLAIVVAGLFLARRPAVFFEH